MIQLDWAQEMLALLASVIQIVLLFVEEPIFSDRQYNVNYISVCSLFLYNERNETRLYILLNNILLLLIGLKNYITYKCSFSIWLVNLDYFIKYLNLF